MLFIYIADKKVRNIVKGKRNGKIIVGQTLIDSSLVRQYEFVTFDEYMKDSKNRYSYETYSVLLHTMYEDLNEL